MDEKEIAAKVLGELHALAGDGKFAFLELKRAQGFWAIARCVLRLAPSICKRVEELAGDLKGASKRAVAVEVAMALLPPLPWWAPERVVRGLLGRAADQAVALYNKSKAWG